MHKLLAVVTRAVNYRDNDRILTLVTRERGTVTATAYGCRKPQSKLLAAVQPFTYGEYILAARSERLHVRSCEVREPFYNIRLDPDTLQAAAYICILAEEFSNPEEENNELFSLLLHCLKYLCNEQNDAKGVAAFFITKLMLFSGYAPETNYCIECGNEEELTFFSNTMGGAVCANCARQVGDAKRVPEGALKAIEQIARIPNAGYELSREALEACTGAILPIMAQFVADKTSRKLPKLW